LPQIYVIQTNKKVILKSRKIFLCLIFISGGVVLSLELITSRILTPFFGVSLYIWTAILSITLTFLAFGYQFGGWLTKRVAEKYHESLLLFFPILSSLFIGLSSLIYPVVLPKLSGIGLIFGSFLGSAILLAPPLILLSSLNPILIALFRQPSNSKDAEAGFILFISTFGSVVGVLVTALLIVPNLTNYSALLINGSFLGLFIIFVHFRTKQDRTAVINKRLLISSVVITSFCLLLLFFKNSYLENVTSDIDKFGNRFKILSEYSSHSGNLKVIGIIPKGEKKISHYQLIENGLSQNFISKEGEPLSPYAYNLVNLAKFSTDLKSALVLGLGGGEVPRMLSNKGVEVTVVDINPNNLRAAKKYFHYKPNKTKIIFEDARTFVKNCVGSYDLTVLDLFHADGMPEHIMTIEFFKDIKACLNNNGILVSNIFIESENEDTKMSLLATVHEIFGNTHYFSTVKDPPNDDKHKLINAYFIATKKKLPMLRNFPLEHSPVGYQNKFHALLNSHQVFHKNSFENYTAISDNSNTFSVLFAKQYMRQRKKMVSDTPSRILIN